MIKKLFLIGLLFIGVVACDSNKLSETKLKSEIEELDNQIRKNFKEAEETGDYTLDKSLYEEMIKKNIQFYENFPDSPYAEESLNKITSIYLQIEDEGQAVLWRDTLLTKYPNTEHKEGILELQMNYYDFNDYQPEKIEYYANQLLEIENLSDEKRQMIEFRLEHLDKRFEELILLQMMMESEVLEVHE